MLNWAADLFEFTFLKLNNFLANIITVITFLIQCADLVCFSSQEKMCFL